MNTTVVCGHCLARYLASLSKKERKKRGGGGGKETDRQTETLRGTDRDTERERERETGTETEIKGATLLPHSLCRVILVTAVHTSALDG